MQKTVGRKGLKGREAAAPAAEPPKSPVFAALPQKMRYYNREKVSAVALPGTPTLL
jgi:hypothetical protein